MDYEIAAKSEDEARARAWEACLEQTVELPEDTQAVQDVMPYVVGSIERIAKVVPGELYRVSVAYPNDTAGGELTQWINVVFGNTSLKPGVSVAAARLSPTLSNDASMFPGPRFGIKGLRELLGVPQAPLLMTALKPMGKSSKEFAAMAYYLAKGGCDIIKDDHGLADQCWAPFEERVALCARAVQVANSETGRNALYAPSLNAPCNKVIERAHYAKKKGAGAVMLLPGITGFDTMRELAADDSFGLPLLLHPAMLGGWLGGAGGDAGGMAHDFLFGTLPRLVGADVVIFPNAGGRFKFTPDECQAVAEGCRRPMGRFMPALPCPAGGMKLHRVGEMRQCFGDDTVFLIGGALLQAGPNLEANAFSFAEAAGRHGEYEPPPTASKYLKAKVQAKGVEKPKENGSAAAVSGTPKANGSANGSSGSGSGSGSGKRAMNPRALAAAALLMSPASHKGATAALRRIATPEVGKSGQTEKKKKPLPIPDDWTVEQMLSAVKGMTLEGNKSKVLRFSARDFRWLGVPQEAYKQDGSTFRAVSRVELMGKRGESCAQHTRYFECAPGGFSTLERHEHEHTVVVLRGQGEVQLGPEIVPLSFGDVVYTAPNHAHQFRCAAHASEPFGFLCIVAADRDRPKPLTADEAKELLKGTDAASAVKEAILGGAAASGEEAVSACEWKPKGK